MDYMIVILPLLSGWMLDRIFGDPACLPHPIVGFGRAIAFFEHRLNRGGRRFAKGAFTAAVLVSATFFISLILMEGVTRLPWIGVAVEAVLIFFCLAGRTLVDEVKMVFVAADMSLEQGRRQVARIVGRDTATLSDRDVRTAALETLAENLSDGVVAPLFWYALLGVPGMLAYKMINTLDSMIGYRNSRYKEFGCVAARLDDAANWLPARITSLLMVLVAGRPRLIRFVIRFGSCHSSPNSGYPEAALAGILDCRFGGSHDYFGESVYKPYIGTNPRDLTSSDMLKAVSINRRVEVAAVALACLAALCQQAL